MELLCCSAFFPLFKVTLAELKTSSKDGKIERLLENIEIQMVKQQVKYEQQTQPVN